MGGFKKFLTQRAEREAQARAGEAAPARRAPASSGGSRLCVPVAVCARGCVCKLGGASAGGCPGACPWRSLPGYVAMWLCGYVAMWLCGYVCKSRGAARSAAARVERRVCRGGGAAGTHPYVCVPCVRPAPSEAEAQQAEIDRLEEFVTRFGAKASKVLSWRASRGRGQGPEQPSVACAAHPSIASDATGYPWLGLAGILYARVK